jgi:hypothetical protein
LVEAMTPEVIFVSLVAVVVVVLGFWVGVVVGRTSEIRRAVRSILEKIWGKT